MHVCNKIFIKSMGSLADGKKWVKSICCHATEQCNLNFCLKIQSLDCVHHLPATN